MEKALRVRDQEGIVAAAEWLENEGIPWELAIIALVGGRRAIQYGVRVDVWGHPGESV